MYRSPEKNGNLKPIENIENGVHLLKPKSKSHVPKTCHQHQKIKYRKQNTQRNSSISGEK
jgi:hypothetical protein